MKESVLFLCHKVDEEMFWRYASLTKDLSALCDVYWALQTDLDTDNTELHRRDVRLFGFTFDELKVLRYTPIAKSLIPGSLHHVILYFYRQHPEYDYYWLIEYDVIFTGNWKDFTSVFATSDADFITSHVEKRNEQNNEWTWWTSLKCDEGLEKTSECLLRSFNPIYRISRRALMFLDQFLQLPGVQGHAEVLLPTLLYDGKFSIMDFGGTGEFVPKGFQNRFYIQGEHPIGSTFRWRPVFSRQEVEGLGITGKLFHPVKC